MQRRTFTFFMASWLVISPLLFLVPVQQAAAITPANDPFQRTWARTDDPVATGQVSRTWMWGPEVLTEALPEPYQESPDGERTVQYFDKSRMEITHPDAVDDGLWYVTNGLLVVELITGKMQVGDDSFEDHQPAQVNVAGDADDPTGPTYATFNALMSYEPFPIDGTLTQRIDRNATATDEPDLASYSVTAAYLDAVTNHTVASPFWEFMNSTGMIWDGAQYTTDLLFVNPFYATGRPIAEAYWANVKVANTYHDVLIQCFERRCLTYTPANPEGWQVEAGNVGQHYWAWRNEQPTDSNDMPGTVVTSETISAINGGTIVYEDEIVIEFPSGSFTEDVVVSIAIVSPDWPSASAPLSNGRSVLASELAPLEWPSISCGSRITLDLSYKESGQSAELRGPAKMRRKCTLPSNASLDLRNSVYLPVGDGRTGSTISYPADRIELAGESASFAYYDLQDLKQLDLGPYPQLGVAAWDWTKLNTADLKNVLDLRFIELLETLHARCSDPDVHEGVSVTNESESSRTIIWGCITEYVGSGSYSLEIYNRRSIPLEIYSTPSGYPNRRLLGAGESIVIPINASFGKLTVHASLSQASVIALAAEAGIALLPVPELSILEPVKLVNWIAYDEGSFTGFDSEANEMLDALRNDDWAQFEQILFDEFLSNPEFWLALIQAGERYLVSVGADVAATELRSIGYSALAEAIGVLDPAGVVVQSYDLGYLVGSGGGQVILNQEGSSPPPELPGAPTNAQAEALSPYEVRLTWDPASGNVDGYEIFGCSNSNLGQVGPNETSFIITAEVGGLTPGHRHCFKVRAFNEHGDSDFSNEAYVDIPPEDTGGSAPDAPSGLTAEGDHGFSIDFGGPIISLEWDDNSGDEDGFNIYRAAQGSSTYNFLATVSADIEWFDDWELDYSDTWCYVVTAYNDGIESEPTNSACATAPENPDDGGGNDTLDAPSDVEVVQDPIADTLEVFWHDNSGNENGFHVVFEKMGTWEAGANSESFGLEGGGFGTYNDCVAIVAFNDSGTSTSETVCF